MIHAAVALLVLASCAGALAGEPPPTEEREVVIGPQYEAGGFHRFLFGANYRTLWTTPVRLPVLDLATFAGGLTPESRVGHGQTQALAMRDSSGRAWTFRPVVKDPVGLLPEELRQSVAADFVRDQMSSQHPAGHVVVPRFLEAIGILHNTPRLVIMPDDPALGEFRADFAGVVGDIEEFQGQESFGGALEVVSGPEMWKRLDASPADRVDARAYLSLRLVDHLLGDWDRHLEQWLFARIPGQEQWQPFSEDRDQAFVRFEGFTLTFVRPMLPLLVRFGDDYPDLEGLLFDSWDVDRRLLPGLDRAQWEEIARSVQERITDSVIDEAVGRMPADFVEVEGPRLTKALRSRRDKLEEHARDYYRFLSKAVDVRGTFEDDRASVVHHSGGRMELRLHPPDEGAAPYFARTFDPGETSEVRLYLLRGDDRVTIEGADARIKLRVVGDGGADWIDDSASGHARIHAPDPADRVAKGTSTAWDRDEWDPPPVETAASWIPPRDFGRRSLFPITRFAISSEVGLLARVGWSTTGWGFRKLPWADQQSAHLTYSTKLERFRADYSGRYRPEASPLLLGLDTHYSAIEVISFYGYGNETEDVDEDRKEVTQRELLLMPTLRRPLGDKAEVSIGPLANFHRTTVIQGSVLDEQRPYGIEDTGQVGARAAFTLDTTDRAGLPYRGVRADIGGSVYPEAWDVESTFGEVHGQVAAWISASGAPGSPALQLRAGGKKVFGTYPFYEAAFLGGPGTVRGLDRQRYAGDAAVWAGAELTVKLFDISVFAPSQVGLIGIADIGRVYLDDESSDVWHHGLGGGIYVATPRRQSAAGFIVARAEGRTRFYLRFGTGF